MAIQEIQENDYIKDSREVINNNFLELNTLKAPLASPALTGTPTAPTPTAGDNSKKVATTEFVNGYLPLSGGTITGAIISETAYALKRSVDDSSLILYGGTAYNRGAYLNLSGKDSSYASHFNLVAHDGTRSGILDGSPDGTLTWGGYNVITSALTGTILVASGNNTTVSAYATVCSITTHPAGVFLITSFMDLNYSGTGVYINYLLTATHGGIATRTTASGGGGNCAVLLTELGENEVVELRGYQPQSGTMRGKLSMVRLA